jgi:hypothetical protein
MEASSTAAAVCYCPSESTSIRYFPGSCWKFARGKFLLGKTGLDPTKVDYYFGSIDERRVVWSMGRDLMMDPPQQDGPVHAMVKAY